MTEEQWESLKQFDAHKEIKVYTRAERLTFWFAGATLAYLVFQVLRLWM